MLRPAASVIGFIGPVPRHRVVQTEWTVRTVSPESLDLFIHTKTPKYSKSVKNSAGVGATELGATQFLTRSEVSKLLGVSPNTVTRWAREGRLPCQVTLGGHHRFDRELVEQLRKSLYRAGSRAD